MHSEEPEERTARGEEDRREFLKKCGRFAATTPPLVTMLLSTSLTSDAIAKSGAGSSGESGHRGRGSSRREGRGRKEAHARKEH
ncbi:hypothetical protein EHS39_25500 [Ensifer sp. MPMI2T]|nr:hypothetical protein EHS39_25500 [Ensifer sp. MPMI2T]